MKTPDVLNVRSTYYVLLIARDNLRIETFQKKYFMI